MAAVSTERHPRILAVAEEARVTPIELFFDLVFVFAITQVTSLMGDDLTARGIVRGLLVLSLLWWCWVGYAWLGNVVRADEGVGRLAMFGAMAAMFVVALTVPEAFDDLPGGWSGPVVIALGYLAVRVLHLVMFWFAAGTSGDDALRGQLIRWVPSVVGGTALLLVASQLHGTAQTLAWAAALVADYLGTILAGASGWRLNSAAHFAERHGLIVIIALGESIVAIGLGVVHVPVSGPIVAASVLGLALAGTIWWAYFDVVSLIAERTLRRLRGEPRARLARDAYSYLHLPMIAGIVLMALGLEDVLAHVGGEGDHTIGDPLATLPLVAMYCGVALFLVAHVAFAYRVEHLVKVRRLVAAALMLVLIPVGLGVPSLAALALLVAVMLLLIVAETLRFSEERERIRHEED
ncbi:MAG TPA: low temperature requirement protein A [Actinomycetota bacterium]|nr:low temperature requirement protein A [Actinomycetota bacterium]